MEWELFEIMKDAGLQSELQPRHLFDSVVPVRHLIDQRNNGTIVPDIASHLPLPPPSFEPNQPRVRALAARTTLFDIKTIQRGGGHYKAGRVDRQVVIDRRQRGLHDPRAQARGRMRMDGAVNPDDFLAHQVRAGEAA